MTIAVPATLTATRQSALVQPSADESPLIDILQNTAHMYAFGPAHLTCVYTCEDKISNRQAVFQIPILPSADGIDYTFRHHVRTGTGTSNLGLTLEEWTGAWDTIETTTSISAGANTVITYEHTSTVDANATKLRVTWGRLTGADQYTPDSLCMFPAVASIAVGKKTSGYVPFDDGLLTLAGSPIHTEFFNRAVRNAAYLLEDRQQCALAFVQEDDATYVKHEIGAAGLGAGVYGRLGYARFFAPYQVNPEITVLAIATVSGGSPDAIVRVRQDAMQGQSVTLDGDGAINSASLRLAMPGGAMSYADLEVQMTHTTSSEAYLHAVVAYWQPGA